MSDQPTDEWTADYVADRFTIDASSAGQISDAHNAVIAAERSKAHDQWINALTKANDLLAAEREKLADRHKLCVHYETLYKAERDQLAAALKEAVLINALVSEQTKQLAAERRSHAMWEETAKKLDKQLAAEMENTDLWKRQSAFESEHRDKYRTRCEQLTLQLAAERERNQ